MKRLLIPCVMHLLPFLAFGQNCGLEDTLLINTNSTQTFEFEIFDVVNEELADPGQGVCGIEINFTHQFSEDLQLWVTAPDGTMVQLIGDNTSDQFAFTFFANWDISFVPCSTVAMPDSGYVAQWDNNQPNNFVSGGEYFGSYYPFDGCLEDFDSGPVNGTWTITTTNNSLANIGAIFDFRVVLCDPLGQNCCFAEAGNLLGYDTLTACEGDAALALELAPSFDGNGAGPDTTIYAYTYAIAAGDVLLEIDSMPDLTSFAPGSYEVCGFSVRRTDLDSIPTPDGVLLLSALRDDLNAPDAPFCGQLTDSCFQVVIAEIPAPVPLIDTLCMGEVLMVGDSSFTESGNYEVLLQSEAGCDSLVNVDLTFLEINTAILVDTICVGDSVVVANSVYTQNGVYSDTLQTAFGCDSIVNLELTVLEPIFTTLDTAICSGTTFAVGDSLFTMSGNYAVPLQSAFGCDSTVNLTLSVLDPMVAILPPDTLDCNQQSVLLDGSASSGGAGVTYSWSEVGQGAILGAASTLSVSMPGSYVLNVTQSQMGTSCTVTDTVLVTIDTTTPIADAGSPLTLNCQVDTVQLSGATTSMGPAFSYSWSTLDGQFVGGTDEATATVDAAGTYSLIVENIGNACRDTSMVFIAVDTLAPNANAGPDRTLDCINTQLELDATMSSQGANFDYLWQSLGGSPVLDADQLVPTITQPDTYIFQITNTDNFCVASDTVVVDQSINPPMVALATPPVLNCETTSALLDGTASDQGSAFTFFWRSSNGGAFDGGTATLTPTASAAGTYELVVINNSNQCRDSLSVVLTDTTNMINAQANVSENLDCSTTQVDLSANGSTVGPDMVYLWSSTNGGFVGDSTGVNVLVNVAGEYQLIVQDTFTRCADTTNVSVLQDVQLPLLNIFGPSALTCTRTQDTLFAQVANPNPVQYNWSGPCLLSSPDSTYIVFDCPGLYMLEVEDAVNGCLVSTSIQVQIDTIAPTIQIATAPLLNCEVESVALDATASSSGANFNYSWLATDGGNIESGRNSPSPLVDAAGTYELTIENTQNGCQASGAVVVQDSSTTVIANAGLGGLLTCLQDTLLLDGSASVVNENTIFEWSTLDGNIIGSADTDALTIDAPGTYRLVVLDTLTRCTDTASTSILQNIALPLVEAGEGFVIDCALTADTLFSAGSSVGGEFTYTWEGPCVDSDVMADEVVVSCAGTYRLAVTNLVNGCTATDSVVVLEDLIAPVASAQGGGLINCVDSTTVLDGTASSVGMAITYQWLGPGIVNGEATNTITVNQAGTYALIVQDTSNSCADTTDIVVQENTNQPNADAGPPDIITCLEDTIEIGGFLTSQGPSIIYEWFVPEGNIVEGADTPFPTVDEEGVYVLFVTDTLSRCSDTAFVAITANQSLPSLTTGPDLEISCFAPEVELEANSNTPLNLLDIQWSGDCILSDPTELNITVDCPDDYVIQLTDNRNGCVRFDTISVQFDAAAPVANLPDTTLLDCETGEAFIDGSASTPGFYEWIFEDNLLAITTNTISVSTPGIYRLVASNLDLSCSDTAQTVVTVDCAAFANVATPDTLTCSRTAVTLDGSSSDSGAEIEYEWLAPEVACIEAGQGTPTLTVSCSGTYAFVVTNTAIPISDTFFVFVPIDTISPLAVVNPPDSLTCAMPFVVLDGTGSSVGEEYTYEWARSLFETESTQLIDTVFQAGNYFLEVTDTTNGCTAQAATQVINTIVQPQIAFGNNLFPCNSDTFGLQAIVNPPSPNYQYIWSDADGVIAGVDEPIVVIDTVGTFTLSIVDTLNQCGAVNTITVEEQICVTCIDFAPPDTLNCLVDTVQIEADYCAPCEGCTLNWTTTNGSIIDGQGSLSIRVDAPGSYQLEVTDTLDILTVFSVEVAIDTLVPIADAGPDQVLTCTQDTVLLDGSNSSTGLFLEYTWSSNLGGTIIPDNEISAQVVSADTYFLQVANSRNGCVAQDSVVVTANVAFPLADAGADQEFTCNETILILDGSGSSIGNDFVYNWTGPAGASISGATTLNPIMNEAGTYFLLVTDTTNACTALDSVQLSLNTALPELPSFGNPSFTCVDSLVTLDAMLATDSGLTPEWCQLDMSGLPIACFDTDSITVDTVGEWRFELTIDSTGCSASTIVSVGLDTLPPMVDAGPMEIFFCTLDSLALSGTAFANGADLAFSWTSDSTSLINNDTIPNPFIFRPDTFFLTVTNLMNGCVAEDSVIIQGDPNVPFIDAGADTQTNCSEASVQLMGMATTTTGLQNITWSNNGGQILSGATTLTPTVAGGGWFFLQVEEPISTCVAVDSVFVLADTIAPLIILDGPLGFQLDCTTDTLSFSSSNSNSPQGNALSFGWTGSPAGGIIPTPEDSVILIDQVGNYQLVVTDQGNTCQSMVSFEVIGDFEAPEFSIATPPDLNCLRDSVLLLTTLSDTSIQLLIQWEGEDPLGLVDPTVLSPTATRPGNYTLLLTNEQNGCSSDATVFVGIDTIAPVAAIATPDELNCTILQVALDGSLSSQGASIIYNWQAMPGEFIGPTDEVITQTAFPGVYSLQVTNQENGCFSVDSVEVLQPEVPISDVALTIIPPTCNGDQDAIIQVDSVVGGQGPYLVSFNGEPLSSQVVFSNLSAGLYPLLVEDVNGCIWEEEVEVEAPDELIVDIGPPEIEVFLGDTITLDAIVEVPFDTLFWGPASAFADPSSMQQRVLPLETAFYNVTVINENGCTATDRIVLNMTKERAVYIPNVFSPDGDGDNDVIMIFAGAEVAQIRDFQIFDRWGNRVFRSEDFLPNDPNFGWDGNFNGTAMNAAVFVYFAEVEFIDGWVEVIRGDVVLMR